MSDAECVALLQWALPRMELRWTGFRNFRRQVCKRIQRRMAELGLPDAAAYRTRLEDDPVEWGILRSLCVVTISRFYRDRRVWETLRNEVLPALAEAALAAKEEDLRCWSVGCASGEEPYTLSILWRLALAEKYPGLRLRILATDLDEHVLERALAGSYAPGTLRDLPPEWIDQAFEWRRGAFQLQERFRAAVELRQEDVRLALPEETFRLILCRNLVFTYFDEPLQRETLGRLLSRLAEGGAFLLGPHERLPSGSPLEPWYPRLGIHRPLAERAGGGFPVRWAFHAGA